MSQGENPFADDANPYRASSIDATAMPPEVAGSAEAIRRAHIAHEASVKSIGTLYLLGFAVMILGLIGLGVGLFAAPENAAPQDVAATIGMGVVFLVIGSVQGFVGYFLRQLKPWARWVAVVFSAIGLLGIPVGTLISIYFLYLLLSEKANTIFSPEYQHIIAQTPHVKYKTSIVVWILLGVLFVLFALLIGAAIFGG